MAEDSTLVRLAPSGHVYVAAVGTAAPADVVSAWSASWSELGYLDENGVTITPSLSTTDIKAWQSLLPLKTILTGIACTVKFNMQQITTKSASEYFFGQSFTTSLPSNLATMVLSSNPTIPYRALGIEWTDDRSAVNRLIFGNGLITDRDAMVLNRTANTALGVTYTVLDNSGTMGTFLSNNVTLVTGS